nr:CBL-interacting protein kinase 18-like [Ipomoea trifida]
MVSAVDFCHNRSVYHRDLKKGKLLLNEHSGTSTTVLLSVYAVASPRRRHPSYHPPPSKTVILSSALIVCPRLVRVSSSGLAYFTVIVCPTHAGNFRGRIFPDCPCYCNVGLPFDPDTLPECSRRIPRFLSVWIVGLKRVVLKGEESVLTDYASSVSSF